MVCLHPKGRWRFNDEPIASAGADQSVRPGDVVNLDASGSSDPDNDLPLTFAWELQTKPAGSSATLSDSTAANPYFVADIVGDYELTLVVTDAKGLQSAPDSVLISTVNTAPIAEAGEDRVLVEIGVPVQLDGTQSYDDDGDDFVYAWTLMLPAGSSAALDDNTSPTPSFTPDVQGEYVAELVVTDVFFASSDPDQVTLSFENVKPVADAGTGQNVDIGDLVTLDGTGSSDANNDPISFHWVFISKPVGSVAVLDNPIAAVTDFVADQSGSYVVSLVVNDGFVDSDPSNITIFATTTTGAIVALLRDTIDAIGSIPDDALKNKNMANALTNKIIAVLDLVDQGRLTEARDKLLHDVLAKSDGCAVAGTPDRNDWITSCEEQAAIYALVTDTVALIEGLL